MTATETVGEGTRRRLRSFSDVVNFMTTVATHANLITSDRVAYALCVQTILRFMENAGISHEEFDAVSLEESAE